MLVFCAWFFNRFCILALRINHILPRSSFVDLLRVNSKNWLTTRYSHSCWVIYILVNELFLVFLFLCKLQGNSRVKDKFGRPFFGLGVHTQVTIQTRMSFLIFRGLSRLWSTDYGNRLQLHRWVLACIFSFVNYYVAFSNILTNKLPLVLCLLNLFLPGYEIVIFDIFTID